MPSPPDRSPFDRPRWTERDAREVLAALRRSGKPVSVFAAEHGLDPQRVYLWRRRLGGAEASVPSKPGARVCSSMSRATGASKSIAAATLRPSVAAYGSAASRTSRARGSRTRGGSQTPFTGRYSRTNNHGWIFTRS